MDENKHKNHSHEKLCELIYKLKVANEKAKLKAFLVQLVNTE